MCDHNEGDPGAGAVLAVREVQCCGGVLRSPGVLSCPGLDRPLLRTRGGDSDRELSAAKEEGLLGAARPWRPSSRWKWSRKAKQPRLCRCLRCVQVQCRSVQVQCRCSVSHGFSWSLCFARTSVRPWWKTHCPATWMHCNETMLPTMLPDCLRREVKCPR